MGGRGHDPGGNMRWLLTYADMITLLLAFFVIMYAVSKVDAKKYKAFTASVQAAFGAPAAAGKEGGDPLAGILETLRQHLDEADIREGRIHIERNADGIVLRFQDAVFFERGKADLSPAARRILDAVAAAVAGLPNAMQAEGHTDTLPIRSARFPSNWELSVARATAVVRYLLEAHGLSPLRLSARGLGEHQPIFPNHPSLGEPRNRRVELKILARG